MDEKTTPKLCDCGCGIPAPIAKRTDLRRQMVKGEPTRFVLGHAQRKWPSEHSGLCACGCGITIRSTGGKPPRYVAGHQRRKWHQGLLVVPDDWTVEDRRYTTPCWIWRHYIDAKGYGIAHRGKVTTRAHRIAYAQFREPIPNGMVLDHLCNQPGCVNPWHCEVVTNAENSRRAQIRLRVGAASARALLTTPHITNPK